MSTSTQPPPLPSIAYPGLSIGSTLSHTAGPGTHVQDAQIIASLPGRPAVQTSPKSSTPKSSKAPNSKPTISIPRLLPSPHYAPIPSANISNTNILPRVGSIVLARVVRVRTRQVDVGILCVGDVVKDNNNKPIEANNETTITTPHHVTAYGGEMNVCANEWPAVVRREDIRATEKDKVVCAEGFRVGDVIRGVVISLGDQANYYLSTARNELGVVMARSEGGETMVPVSWREFEDLGTGVRESRKVAKPF